MGCTAVMHFCRLYAQLCASRLDEQKEQCLGRYLTRADRAAAGWAVLLLSGHRPPRACTAKQVRQWVQQASALPSWLIEAAYRKVGDWAETLAKLTPAHPFPVTLPIDVLMEHHILAMRNMSETEKRASFFQCWDSLDDTGRYVLTKLLTGALPPGMIKSRLFHVVARFIGCTEADLRLRLAACKCPNVDAVRRILAPPESKHASIGPYPFVGAVNLDVDIEALGHPDRWFAEWAWDGSPVQIDTRDRQVRIWSSNHEMLNDHFPELVLEGSRIAAGLVMEGCIIPWENHQALPVSELARRLRRRSTAQQLIADVPVLFMAADLLQTVDCDWRAHPLHARRHALEQLFAARPLGGYAVAPQVPFATWDQLRGRRLSNRPTGVLGLTLKPRDSTRLDGGPNPDWRFWPNEPSRILAALIMVRALSTRDQNAETEYTFGLRSGVEWLPIARSTQGVSDAERNQISWWVRENTIERKGPVVVVKPDFVYELAYDGVSPSRRHKSGMVLRHVRVLARRQDRSAGDLETLDTFRARLLNDDRLL